ncbi:hypothetical protein [Bremerella sp.]|uniref:hypothetical protein n=1 Tax=Bremerella sp. TaxID=2795602 RepID=UPI00391CEC43
MATRLNRAKKMNDYCVRPGYGSGELLIEFSPDSAVQTFFAQLMDVLNGIGTRVTSGHDLWMNDEVLLVCESDHGDFLISKDIWDFVFIMAPHNEPLIHAIDDALNRSEHFNKHLVNPDDYR